MKIIKVVIAIVGFMLIIVPFLLMLVSDSGNSDKSNKSQKKNNIPLYPPTWSKSFPPASSLGLEGMGDSVLAFTYVQRFPIPKSAMDSSNHIYDSLEKEFWYFTNTKKDLENKWSISKKSEDSIQFINAQNKYNFFLDSVWRKFNRADDIGSIYKPMDTIYINKKNGEIIKNYTWKERSCRRLDSSLGLYPTRWTHYWYEWDSTIYKLDWKVPKYPGAGDKDILGMWWEAIVGVATSKTDLCYYKDYKIILKTELTDCWAQELVYENRKGGYSIPLLNHEIRNYIVDSNSLYILFVDSAVMLQCYNFEDMLPKEKQNKK